MKKTQGWFDQHLEREFRITRLPVSALQDVSKAGWLSGCATAVPLLGMACGVQIPKDATSVLVIVRRPDLASGRSQPGFFIHDGAGVPPLPKGPAGAEERFCEIMWGFLQWAEEFSVSPMALMRSQMGFAAAARSYRS